MPREIERKRLNYMNAYIKYYDDGSQILQSYSTDVVKRTPSGKYIRLWKSWSPSTMKQVKAYCGHYFRGLPYEDGTYEDLKASRTRKGFKYNGGAKYLTKDDIEMYTRNFIRDLQQKNYRWMIEMSYNTLCNKSLKKWAKSEKRKRLLDALYSCATQKPTKNAIGVLARMYNFDIKELWKNALAKDWGELKNA